MTSDHGSESPDSRLDRAIDLALASVHADADPEPWRRARARLEARPVPRGFDWTTHPRAIAFSLALFVASFTLSWALARKPLQGGDDDTSLAAATQLALDADISVDNLLPGTTAPAAPEVSGDSGSAR